MKRITSTTLTAAALALLAGQPNQVDAQADQEVSPIYGIKLPSGYRDWSMISVARVGAPLNDLRVKLGNNIALQAYRNGTLPFPDGTIIARLAYRQATSDEGNAVIRASAERQGLAPDAIDKLLADSFIAGAPTNVQFMVKDSRKYAATGGWGFAQFTNGKPDGEAVQKTCFSCHAPGKDHDFVFTRYAP
jgi:hypothetical protein